MNIYKYLNSKDVAAYLEKIGFEFTPLEAARVIEHCEHINVEEKHAAFRLLIAKTNDEAITIPSEQKSDEEKTTLHTLLKEYVEAEEKMLRSLTKEKFDFYECAFSEKRGDCTDFTIRYLSRERLKTFWDTFFQREENFFHVNTVNLGEPGITYFCFGKDGKAIMVENLYLFCKPYTILRFECSEKPVPIPFERGDLVCESGKEDEPFVFLESDAVSVTGYFIRNGRMRKSEEYVLPIELEYYHGKIQGEAKALQAISDFLKEKKELDEVVNLYHGAMLENYITDK